MTYLGGTVLVIGVVLALSGSWLVAGALFVLTAIVVELYAVGGHRPRPSGDDREAGSDLVTEPTTLG